jgi:cytidylate kinase
VKYNSVLVAKKEKNSYSNQYINTSEVYRKWETMVVDEVIHYHNEQNIICIKIKLKSTRKI